MKKYIKEIISVLTASGIIIGVAIVGFDKPEPLTIEEYQVLTEIYRYEIEKSNGLVLKNVNNRQDLIEILNKELINTPQPSEVEIDGQILTSDEYQLLKSGLFLKSEQ